MVIFLYNLYIYISIQHGCSANMVLALDFSYSVIKRLSCISNKSYLYLREHKKMLMQMEDFQNKMKDIQFMKVTREIQQVIVIREL